MKEINALQKEYYMACIWPAAKATKTAAAEEILKEAGRLVFQKEVRLTYRGMKNFMTQIYGHQAWAGTIENRFCGIKKKAWACYRAKKPVKTYVFAADSFETVVAVKERIRVLYGIGKHSIHISDNQEETLAMIQLLYYPNSLAFLNTAAPYRDRRVFCRLLKERELFEKSGLDENRFLAGAEATLALYGDGKAKNFTYYTDYTEEELQGMKEGIPFYKDVKEAETVVSQCLYNPQNYFYFHGIKVLTWKYVQGRKWQSADAV